MTFVAANGDELHMTYTGTCSPDLPVPSDVVTCHADNAMVDGTGRFAHATGEAHLAATISFTPPAVTGAWMLDGTVGY